MRNGLIRGYRTAYQSVVQPVEGTILSVARDGIEHIRAQITRNTTIDTILAMYLAEMRKTLAFTPEMLSVLKEAGVVDSGAYGFVLIFEGMLKYLYGETITSETKAEYSPKAKENGPDFSLFNERSEFTYGYCMEFILQLMVTPGYDQNFRLPEFIQALKARGESIVCVQDGKRVKVHVHTKTPSNIIYLSQKYGEFLTFKLENMQIQHNEYHGAEKKEEEKPLVKKPLSSVAVVNGDGMAALFKGLGCDAVIDGGATMNTSSEEFIEALKGIPSDRIVILPNSKNVVPAAEQAAKLSVRDVTVIPTRSVAEGYAALAMDIQDSDDTDRRISQMRMGAEGVITLSETTASRDFTYHIVSCKKGDEIVLRDGELICVSSDMADAAAEALKIVLQEEEKETCVVFKGMGMTESDEDRLREAVESVDPLLDVEFMEGGQEIYHWIMCLM